MVPSHRHAERVRALNDAFRKSFTGGSVMLTLGVHALPSDVQLIILRRVATFDAFTADDDPHGEHDFGKIEEAGHTVLFKIDYYDPNLEYGSDEPWNVKKTARVMTIMLAEEY